jgi:hypothetical protein
MGEFKGIPAVWKPVREQRKQEVAIKMGPKEGVCDVGRRIELVHDCGHWQA